MVGSDNTQRDHSSSLFAGSWYNTLRYNVVPPAFVVLFTLSVQWLGRLGATPCPLDLNQCSRLLGDSFAWKVVAAFLTWVAVSLLVPANQFIGPESPEGEKPKYQDNGFLFYVATCATFFLLSWFYPTLSEDLVRSYPEILACLNILALILCAWLVLKARLKGISSGFPLLFDFYRGCELHPRVLWFDAKQFCVSRIGMMMWQILIFAAYLESHRYTSDFVTLFIQTIYIAKFYWWESGYFTTLDITYDRAGYYLCWGGMVFIPVLFPISQLHMVYFPSTMSPAGAVVVALLCIFATAMEYAIDRQKEIFVEWRQKFAKGKAKQYRLWGKPVPYIDVSYQTTKGEVQRSALLVGGFWGLARHMNYTFEVIMAFLWCVPAATGQSKFFPMLYFYFIAGLIAHRILRDEDKCQKKYGKCWKQYCEIVPYRFIPGIF